MLSLLFHSDSRARKDPKLRHRSPAALPGHHAGPTTVSERAGATGVREVMKVPLGRLGRAALALLGKFPAEEVAANLHRLKQVMETGSVTDTSYSVAGKFAQGTPSHDALRPRAGGVGKPGPVQKSKTSLLSQILWCLTSIFLPRRCAQRRQRTYGEASAQRLNRRELKK
jgi:hypothetical protein